MKTAAVADWKQGIYFAWPNFKLLNMTTLNLVPGLEF